MSYTFYKFLHIASILLIFISMGGLTALAQKSNSRKIFGIVNGIALILVFVAGFGLIARLQLQGAWPLWVWCKIAGWFIIGLAPKFVKTWSPIKILSFYGSLGVAMAYLALFKPF